MSWLELAGGRFTGLLPWLGLYHRLAFQRDAGGGVREEEEELLEELEDELTRLDARHFAGGFAARLFTPSWSLRTTVHALTLWEAATDDVALFEDSQVVRLAVEGERGRWYHFTGVVQPRQAGEAFRRLELVASHGVRTAQGEP